MTVETALLVALTRRAASIWVEQDFSPAIKATEQMALAAEVNATLNAMTNRWVKSGTFIIVNNFPSSKHWPPA